MFSYQSGDVGNEFISFFITSLYCRIYIPNQMIVRRGENFSELYMIFEGKVVVSLRNKYEHEFFMLYATNYFGDYQILEDHLEQATFMHCLKAKVLIDLLRTFPDAMVIFRMRA
jgi:hypothetical protein